MTTREVIDLVLTCLVPVLTVSVAVTVVMIVDLLREPIRARAYSGLRHEGDAAQWVRALRDATPALDEGDDWTDFPTSPERAAWRARHGALIEVPVAEPVPAVVELRLTRVELDTRGAGVGSMAPHPIFAELESEWARLVAAGAELVRV